MRATLGMAMFVAVSCSTPPSPTPQAEARPTLVDAEAAAAQKRQVAKDELNTRMRTLTTALLALSDEVGKKAVDQTAADVPRLLGYIETIETEARATANLPLGDPHYRENLDGFLAELNLARAQVQKGQPSAHVQGTVIGACVYCHEFRECRGRQGLCPDVRGL
jgi:hypothetical protein